MIVALHRFKLLYLADRSWPDSASREQTVEIGQAVAFTDGQLHSGGGNPESYDCIRLFTYAVHHEEDFPVNQIWLSSYVADGFARRPPLELDTSFTSSVAERTSGRTSSGRATRRPDYFHLHGHDEEDE